LSALTEGVQGLLQKGAELRIYNRVRYGQLARFHLLDTRQYRDAPLSCGIKGAFKADSCDHWMQPRSMLGPAQEQWLTQGLQQADAPDMPRWNLLTQSVVFSTRMLPVLGGRLIADGWDGYPKARQAILDSLQKHHPPGPVIFSGDAHEFWAAHVNFHPSDATQPVLPEFVCAGITSRAYGNLTVEDYMALNPHLVAGERRYRGYTLVKLTPDLMQVDWRAIDSVTTPQPKVHTAGRFEVRHAEGKIKHLA
jgi:alkaline phosphatase D